MGKSQKKNKSRGAKSGIHYYVEIAARKKEKPTRKSIVEDAVKAVEEKEGVILSVRSVTEEVEKLKPPSLGNSAMKKAVKAVVDDLKKQIPPKREFAEDDDVIRKSKSTKHM